MKTRLLTTAFACAIFILITLSACSGTKSPVLPPSPEVNDGIPVIGDSSKSNRDVVAVYDAVIDPIAGTFEITPEERSADYHFPLSKYFPNVLKITGYGFTPNFWADIKLSHPYPGSGIDGFDPRVIAIVHAHPSHYFHFSILDANGNADVVLEPDGYTKLFDELGGPIAGNTNPFKAYFKSQPYRRWSSTGTTQQTQRWNINLDGFGGPMIYKLVVDVSTHYPNPPQPVVDNTPEPVQLDVNISPGLTTEGGNAPVDVIALDWQGFSGMGGVFLECPELFNGIVSFEYAGPGPNPDEYLFHGEIFNSRGAGAGDYLVLATISDQVTGIAMYNIATAHVENVPANPVEVTPKGLNFSPKDVFVRRDTYNMDYAFMACGDQGLHWASVYDINNPHWVDFIETPGSAGSLFVTSFYAYIADGEAGMTIVDVDPIFKASVVKTVDTPGSGDDIFASKTISGNVEYAYIADGYEGVQIIDVLPIDSAYIVSTIDTDGYANAVWVLSGYLYIADLDNGLQIYNISNITNPILVKEVYVAEAMDVEVETYAYVTDYNTGLQIISVSPPESAAIVKTVVTDRQAQDIFVESGYAYITNRHFGMNIIDVDPVGSAYVAKKVALPGYAKDVYNRYGTETYIANPDAGLQIIDVDPKEGAYLLSKVESAGDARNVTISDGYAYVGNCSAGLAIFDIQTPESATLIHSVDTPGASTGLDLVNPYVFVADEEPGIQAIDISTPENAYIAETIATTDFAYDVDIENGYAYVAAAYAGLQIIDIDPLDSAYIVKSVNTSDIALSVYLKSGFAYVANGDNGLKIIDVDPPESAYIVKTVGSLGYTTDVDVANGYAYVATDNGLKIVDIDPPETAALVQTVSEPGSANGVDISGGFAYVTDYFQGLFIIDITPPETAYVYRHVDPISGNPEGIYVDGNYAYIASRQGGLHIIKLW